MTGLINMNVHHLSEQPAVSLVEGGDPFVALEVSAHPAQVNVFLCTPAECDALILAAVAAKDLLLAAALAPCGRPEPHDPHGRCPGVAAPPLPQDDPPPLSRDLSGDLDAIPPNRIGAPS